ncbi:MAG: nucleotide sugar dehydrogenase [Planctomycetota bacterium]|nr:nucleotide sugar dehydrogenase [Planctomycetota bacterium]
MTHEELLAAIRDRTATIGVVGLGAVGLPLARTFARAGVRVLGFDRDPRKLASLAAGTGAPAHLGATFASELLATGRFEVAADPERMSEVAVALVCVPTPLTRGAEPDLSDVLDAGRTLARWIPRGALVVLESTTWPGTTRGPFRDVFLQAGRTPGEDVYLAFSPEREDPGRAIDPRNVPKIVGGTCARSAVLAESLYASAYERVVPVSSAEVAESAKLLENVYRAVNIALVNELKVAFHALGVDVGEVIDAAATKPFGFQRFAPGPGTGGHCIPIDPHYLAWAARAAGRPVPLVEAATRVNAAMPAYVVERAELALASQGHSLRGARVLVLGLAYKPDVDITAESPALAILSTLRERGALASYSDPHVAIAPLCAALAPDSRRSVALDAEGVARADVVLVVTDHAAFDWDLVARHARLVVDARRALESRMRGDPRYFPA